MALGLIGDLLFLLLLLLLFVPPGRAQCGAHSAAVAGAVGGSVCLSPSPGHQKSYSRVHWRLNGKRKLASWDPQGKVQYPNSTFRDRLELLANYSLKISRLQKGDSGEYQLYLEDDTGKEDRDSVTLRVYDAVPKPRVTATVIEATRDRCNATLECSVGLQEVTYEWIPPRQVMLEGGEGGAVQKISFNPSEGTYVCRVSNPASSNSASLTYRHPCSWTAESSTAVSCTATGGLVLLGHLLLLFFHLSLA